MKIRLEKKGSFRNHRCNFNAGESFHCYYREYSIDGDMVRLEKANQLSGYGMSKLPEWTIVVNNSPLHGSEIETLLTKRYSNLERINW
jgi:hypothetical protein